MLKRLLDRIDREHKAILVLGDFREGIGRHITLLTGEIAPVFRGCDALETRLVGRIRADDRPGNIDAGSLSVSLRIRQGVMNCGDKLSRGGGVAQSGYRSIANKQRENVVESRPLSSLSNDN
jgi:hypothetical protein